MPTPAEQTLSDAIVKFKAASALAVLWTQGDNTIDVVGASGTYPSLAKLVKTTQDTLTLLQLNPTLLGKGGFTPPKGTTAEREAAPGVARIRYNTDLSALESYGVKGWLPLSTRLLATYSGSVGVVTGTSRIPYGNVAPVVSGATSGTQLWSKAVTPTVVGSVMQIHFSCMADNTNQNTPVTLAVFRDNTLLGFVSSASTSKGNNMPIPLSISVNDTSTSLTPVTYSCRVGNDSSGTWYIGRGQTLTMGGVNNAGWSINEVLP